MESNKGYASLCLLICFMFLKPKCKDQLGFSVLELELHTCDDLCGLWQLLSHILPLTFQGKILLSTGKNEEFTQTFPVTETLLVSLKISVTPWYMFWNCTSSDGWIPAFMGKKPLADWSLAKIPAKGLPSWTSSLTRQKGRFSFHKWQFLPPDCNVPQISV